MNPKRNLRHAITIGECMGWPPATRSFFLELDLHPISDLTLREWITILEAHAAAQTPEPRLRRSSGVRALSCRRPGDPGVPR